MLNWSKFETIANAILSVAKRIKVVFTTVRKVENIVEKG